MLWMRVEQRALGQLFLRLFPQMMGTFSDSLDFSADGGYFRGVGSRSACPCQVTWWHCCWINYGQHLSVYIPPAKEPRWYLHRREPAATRCKVRWCIQMGLTGMRLRFPAPGQGYCEETLGRNLVSSSWWWKGPPGYNVYHFPEGNHTGIIWHDGNVSFGHAADSLVERTIAYQCFELYAWQVPSDGWSLYCGGHSLLDGIAVIWHHWYIHSHPPPACLFLWLSAGRKLKPWILY